MVTETALALARRTAHAAHLAAAQIPTKDAFLAGQKTGQFGNYLRCWNTLEDLSRTGYDGHITIRSRKKNSPFFVADTIPSAACHYLQNIGVNQAQMVDLFFQEIPNPNLLRNANLEGGYIEAGSFLSLALERDTLSPVRGICERAKHYSGVLARLALEYALRPDSLDELDRLWSIYPNAIIEATEFKEPVGALEKNLVIWEVREY